MTAIWRTDARSKHVSTEALALLVEGRDADAEVHEHLSRCPQCFRVYSEGVQAQSDWLQGTGDDPGRVAALIRVGKSRGPAVPAAEVDRRGGGKRGPARAAMALAAVAALVLVVVWQRSGPAPGPTTSARLDPVLRAEVLAYSAQAFVLPGGEAGAADATARSRGTGTSDASPAAAAAWDRHLAGGDGAEDGIQAVAAYLALGKTRLASNCLVSLAADHPSDVRVMVLQGVAAYQLGDPQGAEEALRRALAADPEDALAALDLGLLLKREGRPGEAGRILESVVRNADGTPLAGRAGRELGTP